MWRFDEKTSSLIPCEFFEFVGSQGKEWWTELVKESTLEQISLLLKALGDTVDFNQVGVCLNLAHLFDMTVPEGYIINERTDVQKRTQVSGLTELASIVEGLIITRWYRAC